MHSKGKIEIEIDNVTPEVLALYHETIRLLITQGVLGMRNGSANLWFDDVGLLQKIDFEKVRRKREGEKLMIIPQNKCQAIVNYDENGEIGVVSYKTWWRRKVA